MSEVSIFLRGFYLLTFNAFIDKKILKREERTVLVRVAILINYFIGTEKTSVKRSGFVKVFPRIEKYSFWFTSDYYKLK